MPSTEAVNSENRLHDLDAVRAFALLLGVFFHASLSFLPLPIGWAVMDVSGSMLVGGFITVSHSFRMALFFLIAGFFSRMGFHRKGAKAFISSRGMRLGVPFLAGWPILYPLVVSGWAMGAASMRGEVDVMAGLQTGFSVFHHLPQGIFVGTHLWFLYYLILITVVVISLRGLISLSGSGSAMAKKQADRLINWLSTSPFGTVALAVLSYPVLFSMQGWGVDTPDKSLSPDIPVLMLYGGCFSFGWLLHRQPEALGKLGRLSWGRISAGFIACTASLVLGSLQGDPSHPQYALGRYVYLFAYALMLWSLVFLTIGLFRKLCTRPRRIVRYLADASYWIYLLHLPLVVWMQVTVSEWSLHWSLKWPFIFLVTVAICLLTYALFVRSSPIGRVLNGRARGKLT